MTFTPKPGGRCTGFIVDHAAVPGVKLSGASGRADGAQGVWDETLVMKC
jgi:hypothetical protein